MEQMQGMRKKRSQVKINIMTGYIICRAPGEIKMQGFLLKIHEEFQDSHSKHQTNLEALL